MKTSIRIPGAIQLSSTWHLVLEVVARAFPSSPGKKKKEKKSNCSGGTHASRGGKHKRAKTRMLDLTNSLFVCSALCTFMLAVGVWSVRRSIRVKYADIKKRRLEPTTPKTGSLYIQPSTIIPIASTERKRLSTQRLERRFFGNIIGILLTSAQQLNLLCHRVLWLGKFH